MRRLTSMKKVGRIEHYMMVLLSKRLEAIANEMVNITLRSARSGVMNVARDFSCSIVTGDGRLLFIYMGQPVHIANSDFVVQRLLELFQGDIHEGDDFLCNSPYYGNTHHADHTHIVPVFYEGELMFLAVIRAHQADVGNSLPTTYMPYSKDLYEEGAIDWPMVRVQRNYEDIADVVRMGKMRIRVSSQWYDDYLAQVGACRVAERRLKELCVKYGKDYIKAFIEAYMEYGEAAVVEEIRKLKKAHLEYETRHDPVPGVADDGIPVRMKIDIDVSDNIDSVPGGRNMSLATTHASSTQGILGNLDLELCTLRVTQTLHRVNREYIMQPPKTRSGRRLITLSPSLALLLREYRTQVEMQRLLLGKPLTHNDLCFAHPDGTPLDPSTVTHIFGRVVHKAGLELRLHDLRHSYASIMLAAGVNIKAISQALGHANVSITLNIYSHLLPGAGKSAAEKFDRLLEPWLNENVGKMLANQDQAEQVDRSY